MRKVMLLDNATPPHATWFQGREPVTRFFGSKITEPGQVRMIPIRANGQPGVATYLRTEEGTYRANSLHVLSLRGNQVQMVVAFLDSSLFALFDLPTA